MDSTASPLFIYMHLYLSDGQIVGFLNNPVMKQRHNDDDGAGRTLNESIYINCSQTTQHISSSSSSYALTLAILYTVFCSCVTVSAALETVRAAVDYRR